jgi:hypothetical protein
MVDEMAAEDDAVECLTQCVGIQTPQECVRLKQKLLNPSVVEHDACLAE